MTFTEFCKKHGLHQDRMESHGGMWARVAIEEMQVEIDALQAALAAQPAQPLTDGQIHKAYSSLTDLQRRAFFWTEGSTFSERYAARKAFAHAVERVIKGECDV